MDLSELIKCYNMEHKSLFTAFAVSFPVLFTVLYLYIPEFANLEFYEQVVFSATASIFCVYISYLFVAVAYIAARIRYNPQYLFLLSGTVIASSLLIFFPDNYKLGYRYVIRIFFLTYIFFYGFIAFGFLIVRACVNCFVYYFRHQIDKNNAASEPEKENEE